MAQAEGKLFQLSAGEQFAAGRRVANVVIESRNKFGTKSPEFYKALAKEKVTVKDWQKMSDFSPKGIIFSLGALDRVIVHCLNNK
jgi:hypothetical protein